MQQFLVEVNVFVAVNGILNNENPNHSASYFGKKIKDRESVI